MKRKSVVVAVALAAAMATALAACGGTTTTPSTNNSGTPSSGANKGNAVAAYNAAVSQVFNPSDKKGGTLRMADDGDFDSLDPADTYYGYVWDFIRLYGRSLVTFSPSPGTDSVKLVPDLAESLGTPGDGGKTWTYHIRTPTRTSWA